MIEHHEPESKGEFGYVYRELGINQTNSRKEQKLRHEQETQCGRRLAAAHVVGAISGMSQSLTQISHMHINEVGHRSFFLTRTQSNLL